MCARERMVIALLAWVAAILIGGGVAVAADCEEQCETCSADPAFVQRDFRNPEMIRIIRSLGVKGLAGEKVQSVVVFEGPLDTTREVKDEVRYTVVLICASGRTVTRYLKTDLPPEVKTYLGKG